MGVTEEIYIASLEAKSKDWAKVFYKIIQDAFPQSLKLIKLKGMKYESDGNYERALEFYQELIDGNPDDTRIIKRVAAIYKVGRSRLRKWAILATVSECSIKSWKRIRMI